MRERIEKKIWNYSFKPEPSFYKEREEKKPLYFGIELEVQGPNKSGTYRDWNRDVRKFPDFVYCKDDSSVIGGYEIVSHPTSFKWLVKNRILWSSILKIRKIGYKSYNTDCCGMHIHMNKSKFNSIEIYKYDYFIRSNEKFIRDISQRTKRNLSKWAGIDRDGEYKSTRKAKERFGGERHVAFNVNNRETVELRIFRGTLNPKSFYKNIEFCHSLYYFLKNCSLAKANPEEYMKYVEKRRLKYINLHSFLHSSKFRTASKVEK